IFEKVKNSMNGSGSPPLRSRPSWSIIDHRPIASTRFHSRITATTVAMPIAIAARKDSFITENGSSRARVSRTRRGPRRSAAPGSPGPGVFFGLRLAPREAEPLPVPIVCSEVSAEDGDCAEGFSAADAFSEKAGSVDADYAVLAGPGLVLESLVRTEHPSFGAASAVNDCSDSSEPRTS